MKRANIDKTITPPTYVTKAKASKKWGLLIFIVNTT
jgi:hypothetical protein